MDNHFKYLLFLDQDSILLENSVQKLIHAYSKLVKSNVLVGAVGPRVINRQTGKEYRGNVKKGVSYADNVTETIDLISSASLIEMTVFEKIGLMDEKLFIDGVDHEWCWRAKFKGHYRFFIIETVRLSHQLGEGDRFFLWMKIAIPTPFRTYFQFRNYFILLRRVYVPFYWKASNGLKYMVKILYFPLFVSPRLKYFKNIWKGIYDGVCKL